MSYDGAGTYTLPSGQPVVTGTVISSTTHNNFANDVATAFNDVMDQTWFTQSGTGAVARSVTSKLGEVVSVKDFGAVGDGVTDDTAAIQAAIDSLTGNQKLVAVGVFKTSAALELRRSNCAYDFSQAKFTSTATIIIADTSNVTFVPENIVVYSGVHEPAATADVYPTASINCVSVLIGKNITIYNPKVRPKQGARAISIQTDTGWGSAPYANIRNVRIYGVDVRGDGNAVDGVDITSSGADDMIRDVYVEGFVDGCKRGLNVSTGSNSYNFKGIDIDLTIRGASEVGANMLRLKESRINVRALEVTKRGVDITQIDDCVIDALITGAGGGLISGMSVSEGAAVASQNTVRAEIVGAFTTGLSPAHHDVFYEHVVIDGASTGIGVSGFRSAWGLVVLKNCTTNVSNLYLDADKWGLVVSQGAGANPVILKRDFECADASNQRYGIDLHGEATITLANNATAKPFGATTEFSGMLLINGTAGIADPALFIGGGAVTYLVGGPTATYSVTATTAGKVNVYYTSSQVEIENKTGGEITLRVFAIRMRNSA